MVLEPGAPQLAATLVYLADLPPLLADIVTTMIEGRDDLEVIQGGEGAGPIDAALAAGAPVVVVARSDPGDLAAIDPYLAQATSLSVVAVASDWSSACSHAFHPTSRRLEHISPSDILTAISAAAEEQAR